MKPKLSIEYCTSWGYIAKAISLAEALLKNYKNDVGEVTLIPSSGGVFEVVINSDLVFSKKELNRFPEHLEIFEKFEETL